MSEDRLVIEHDLYPRSVAYDGRWVMANLMGPNVLWLTEALTQVMDLRRGMRVLDMGCGKAVSSIFLAKEFGVEVYATDLWIKPTDNWSRIREAGVEGQVVPVYAEAHQLPYAEGFFDAAVSIDAYQYFGTDDLYLGYFARFLKPGAQFGIVVPGLTRELDELPEHLAANWEPDYWCFHSPEWWNRHFARSGMVEVERADMLQDGWKDWLRWLELCEEHGARTSAEEAALVRGDGGRTLGFTRVVVRRRD